MSPASVPLALLHLRTTGCRMSRRLASRAFGLVPRRASHLFNPSTYLTLGVTALGPSSILPQLRLLKLSFAPPPATHRSLIFTSELSGPRLISPPSPRASSEPARTSPVAPLLPRAPPHHTRFFPNSDPPLAYLYLRTLRTSTNLSPIIFRIFRTPPFFSTSPHDPRRSLHFFTTPRVVR